MKRNLQKRIVNRLVYEIAPIATLVSPKLNTKLLYHQKFGYSPNLDEPITLNEKVLWLKFHTYWNNDLVKQCADKYMVRDYIKNLGLSDILPKMVAAYEYPDQIDWEKLPSKYAMKLNIGCGMNLIVNDKSSVDIKKTQVLLQKWMKQKYWIRHSEMQYKDVKPYIIVEEFLGGINGELPTDYKFYCINGKVELIMFCVDRDLHGHGAKYYYMDRDWKLVCGYGETSNPFEKPECLDQAIEYAEIVSKEFPFVRADFYLLNERIVFGELTFTPAAGMDVDHLRLVEGSNEDIDHVYGRKLELPINN